MTLKIGNKIASFFGLGNNPVNLRAELFSKGPYLPKIASPISDIASQNNYVIADLTSAYRASVDFMQSMGTSLSGIFSQPDAAVVYQAFGTPTAVNALFGPIAIKNAFDKTRISDAIGDKTGSLLGRLSVLQGGAQTAAGLGFAIFRPVSIANSIHASSLLGRVSMGAATSGMGFFAIFFAFLSAALGINIYKGRALQSQLDEKFSIEDKVMLLQKKMETHPDLVFDKLVKKHGSPEKAQRILIDEAFEAGSGNLKAMLKELGVKNVTEETLKELVIKVIASGCSGLSQASIQRQVTEELVRIGMQMKVAKIQLKKDAKMERILGKEGIAALKEITKDKHLATRIVMVDKESETKAEKLVQTIKASASSKITENGIILAICLLEIAALVAGIFFTAGTPLIIAAGLALFVGIAMAALDGYYLYQSYKEEKSAPHDKKMVFFTMALGVASFATLAILSATGVMTFGTVPLIIAFVLFLIWMGQSTATLMILNRNQKLFNEKNPTLKTLLDALENQDTASASAMVKNFTEELKAALEAKMKKKKHNGDIRLATLALIRKVEKIQKAHLEQKRTALKALNLSHDPSLVR